jgi:hypothetical protein
VDGWKPLATQARIAQVPEPNARRYASAFPQFFPARKLGKALVYGPDTVDVLKVIADAFAQKKTRPEVEEILAGLFRRTHDVEPSQPAQAPDLKSSAPAIPDMIAQLLPLAERFLSAYERQTTALEAIAAALAHNRPFKGMDQQREGNGPPDHQTGQESPLVNMVDKEALVLEVMRMRAMGYGAARIRTTLVRAGWGSLAGPGHRLSKSTVAKIIKLNDGDAQ